MWLSKDDDRRGFYEKRVLKNYDDYGNYITSESAAMIKTVSVAEKKSKINPLYSRSFLTAALRERLIEQEEAIDRIVPYLTVFGGNLNAKGKPVAAFMLLGNSGTGKTKTVEALAEILHGDDSKLLKIDCGEFQHSHELAKLVGAPPGYLGHRETQPIMTQAKVNGIASEKCALSLILFDEVEKAHFAMANLLLGVLDKGKLKLGDGNDVDFSKCIVFFTSNLSSREISDLLNPKMGYAQKTREVNDSKGLINRAGERAVIKHFSPEFINRLDEVITYNPLSKKAIAEIFDLSFKKIRNRVSEQLPECFLICTDEAKAFLIEEGFSEKYGARALNRTLQKRVVNNVANLLVEKDIEANSIIRVGVSGKEIVLTVSPIPILTVDGNL